MTAREYFKIRCLGVTSCLRRERLEEGTRRLSHRQQYQQLGESQCRRGDWIRRRRWQSLRRCLRLWRLRRRRRGISRMAHRNPRPAALLVLRDHSLIWKNRREVQGGKGKSFPPSGKDMDNGQEHPKAEDADATTWTFRCQNGRAAATEHRQGPCFGL